MAKRKTGTALVVGCGSIARRHIRNLNALGVTDIAVHDPDRARMEYVRERFGCTPHASLDSACAREPRFALICTPPSAHAAAARFALERGIPCLIEKPVAHTLDSAMELAEAARRSGVPVSIGYQLRQHPAIRWIKEKLDARTWGKLLYLRAQVGQYLPDWRPWQDYRKSYTARRSLGGGILLDASHEIDLALFLGGAVQGVFCASKKLSSLKIDVEDTAELTLFHQNGALGSVHLDMIRRSYDRRCELTLEDGVVVWSYEAAVVREFSSRTGKWRTHSFDQDGNTAYLNEVKTFIRGLNGSRSHANNLADMEDGIRSITLVEAAKKSARTGAMVRIR